MSRRLDLRRAPFGCSPSSTRSDLPTLALATAMLILLFALRAWFPRLPGPLIVYAPRCRHRGRVRSDRSGVAAVGDIPRGLPVPLCQTSAVSNWRRCCPRQSGSPSGYSDNVLTARAFAVKRHESIDSGQEFVALGAANVAAGLFHGFPVSSSGSRTVLGDAMGSRTQLYSLVAMVSVLLTMFSSVRCWPCSHARRSVPW